MSKLFTITIDQRMVEKKIRKPLPPSQRATGSPKGKRGYDRQRDKRSAAREWR